MQQIWLVPLDGSDTSLRAVAWVLDHAPLLKQSPQVHLLNVQATLPSDIGRFINADTIRDFHRDNGMKALDGVKSQLEAAGISSEQHVLIGESAPTICEFAEQHACTQIVIGTHGHTGLAGTLLGSVAMRVAHQARVPVLLVR